MRTVVFATVLAASAAVAQETPPTVTPPSTPTTTTHVRRAGPGSLQGMPVGIPGFGVPAGGPRDDEKARETAAPPAER